MQDFRSDFIEFAIAQEVLRLGQFHLKSGRTSPYFFDAGQFKKGALLARLGQFYAQAIVHSGIEFDVLFGPAYKGIPLVVATAIALASEHNRDVPYCFNRKEAKTHGEGGTIVGAELTGRVLIVDDVITAGTAVYDAIEIIRQNGAQPTGVIIALDRQEKGRDGISAIREIETTHNIKVSSITTFENLISYFQSKQIQAETLQAMTAYRSQYGV